ncbi:hypothetical protein, partial [Mesorhizobium sp. M7D.F.Ca.US.004.03.1.1]|uniref:hypothetical protein n=1 Tax=Mesorhizobium sp. M7D.F.Ca.US.004.03.1.1 TaxID=2496702 RepID=UPI0019CF84A6
MTFPAAISISACRFAPRLPSHNILPIGARRKPLAEAAQKAAEQRRLEPKTVTRIDELVWAMARWRR